MALVVYAWMLGIALPVSVLALYLAWGLEDDDNVLTGVNADQNRAASLQQ